MALPAMDWEHGDIPVAADMQAYSDSLNAAYALLEPEKNRSYPIPFEGTWYNYPDKADPELKGFVFVHRFRWLMYRGQTGKLIDMSGQNTEVNFDSANAWDILDLHGISWLVPGMVYRVSDINACCEVETL